MTAPKVRSLAAAMQWRRSVSGRVVFTNGVFDIIHRGHVALLEAARREGAALIAAVNDDASAARLAKGAGRPVNSAADRARVLAAMQAVDCVIIFAEDTPERVIQELAPDVLVKGSDYDLDDVVGRAAVEAGGGSVLTVELEEGYSTTAIVDRIRAAS